MLSHNIKFSVILPVYNGEKYLERAIISVISQTYENWELLIIDDGSHDSSFSIAESCEIKDSRIVILKHPSGLNKGVSASRNLGIKFSSGEWIAFLDVDDIWMKDKLDKEFEIISSNDDLVLIYSKAIVKDPDNLNNRDESVFGSGVRGKVEDPFNRLIKGFLVSISSLSVKRKIIEEVKGFDENLHFAEDTLLIHQVLEFGNIYFIDEALSYYGFCETSISALTSNKDKITARFTIYRLLLNTVKEKNYRIVSKALVNVGFKRILRSYIIFPNNDLNLVLFYLKDLLRDQKVRNVDKLRSLVLFFLEFFLFPIKVLLLKR